MVLLLCSDALVAGFSKVSTLAGVAARDILPEGALLLFWQLSSAEKKRIIIH